MAQTPLLDKLGGVKAVRLVVDEFYARVLADERINGFFKDTSMAKLKQHQVHLCTDGGLVHCCRPGSSLSAPTRACRLLSMHSLCRTTL